MVNYNIISAEMIKKGIDDGVIIISFKGGDHWCRIGEYSFCFLCGENDSSRLSEEEIVRQIKAVLDDFVMNNDTFGDEYLYYYYYLKEQAV